MLRPSPIQLRTLPQNAPPATTRYHLCFRRARPWPNRSEHRLHISASAASRCVLACAGRLITRCQAQGWRSVLGHRGALWGIVGRMSVIHQTACGLMGCDLHVHCIPDDASDTEKKEEMHSNGKPQRSTQAPLLQLCSHAMHLYSLIQFESRRASYLTSSPDHRPRKKWKHVASFL